MDDTQHVTKSMKKDKLPSYHVSHSNSALQKLYALYRNRELSDIQLLVGGMGVFKAHKLILCMSSDVFKTMLTNTTWPEAGQSQILLREDIDCECVFGDFLQYLYTGSIQLNQQTALPVLKLADKYNISTLSQECISFMCSNCLPIYSNSKLVSWLQYASMCEHKELEKQCRATILWNFQHIITTDDFLCMNSEFLFFYLQNCDLIIADEETVFHSLNRWFKHNVNHTKDDTTLKNIIHQLLLCVRFPFIPSSQLDTLKTIMPLGHMLPNFDTTCILTEFYKSRSTVSSENGNSSSSCSSNFFPRNYTSDNWSTTIAVDNFSEFRKYDVMGAFFSTPVYAEQEADEETVWDWHIDLYPKGILFQKCILIGVPENFEVEETELKTVRIAIKSMSGEKRHVKVTVLVFEEVADHIFVVDCVSKCCSFDSDRSLHTIDNIIPFSELNREDSPYLIGKDKNCLKFQIIIKSLTVGSDSVS